MIAFVFSIILFSCLDIFWIQTFVLPQYQASLSEILLFDSNGQLTTRIAPALMAYSALIFSLWYLVIIPYKEQSSFVILKEGAIVGSCLYATYALTCWSVFKGFHAKIVIADILWGGFIYATTSLSTIMLMRYLKS